MPLESSKMTPGTLSCRTCDELFGDCQATERLFTLASRAMAGLVGADYILALEELKRLRVKCQSANTALMTHWSEHQLKNNAASS
jgi:hypothetical protein